MKNFSNQQNSIENISTQFSVYIEFNIFFCKHIFSLNKSLLGLVAISATSSVSVGPVLVAPSTMETFLNGNAAVTNGTKNCADSKRVHEAKEIIKSADIICFDVDSTVIKEEGIDELAEYCGKGQEVANL